MSMKRVPLDLAETLERSRRAVQMSKELTSRSTRRSDERLCPYSEDSDRDVNEVLKDLSMRLQNESYLRSTFERAAGELRGRLDELESTQAQLTDYQREVTSLHFDLQQERKWRSRFEGLEGELNEKIGIQQRRIETLEEEIRRKDQEIALIPNADSASLQATNQALHLSIQSLSTKYTAALQRRSAIPPSPPRPPPQSYSVDASPSQARIADIEKRLKESSAKYDELKSRLESQQLATQKKSSRPASSLDVSAKREGSSAPRSKKPSQIPPRGHRRPPSMQPIKGK